MLTRGRLPTYFTQTYLLNSVTSELTWDWERFLDRQKRFSRRARIGVVKADRGRQRIDGGGLVTCRGVAYTEFIHLT